MGRPIQKRQLCLAMFKMQWYLEIFDKLTIQNRQLGVIKHTRRNTVMYLRGSFKKFYLLLQNFVNIKASHMKFVTFVAPSLSYTFMENSIWYHIDFYPYTVKAELRFWTPETGKWSLNKCVDFARSYDSLW